ncbi:MAG TPA: hypothetical protein VGN42_12000 [Pirellulales bacterium]|jgi:hypothetical protein|nr:hypothetical protein [Pirellulales bacterium]
MSTQTIVSAEIMHDLEALCASVAARLPVDPVVARRVQERSESLRKHLKETNAAVELIREAREET